MIYFAKPYLPSTALNPPRLAKLLLASPRFSWSMGASMASKIQKIHGIIHLASLSSAAVGAGLAQVPGSDSAVIVPIQSAMIIGIAHEHNIKVSKAAAADLILTFAATIGGRTFTQWAVGWLPGIGNVINASTAAALTEAIGWAANQYFEDSAS